MAPRAPSATLGLPQAVLDKLPILDKSTEEFLLDFDKSAYDFNRLIEALNKHLSESSRLCCNLRDRQNEIGALTAYHLHDPHIEKATDGFNQVLGAVQGKASESFNKASDLMKEVEAKRIKLIRAHYNYS
ncbi:MAG: hypothetical protein Q9168_002359 [Polycauliona sp. 1 TL-2023]